MTNQILESEAKKPMDINAMIEENLVLTREIAKLTQKTHRYIVMGQIFGIVKIIVIVVPLVVGAVYLAPILKSTIGAYEELLGGGTGTGVLKGGSVFQSILNGQVPANLEEGAYEAQ